MASAEYVDLIPRWERLVVDLNDLQSETEKAGFPVGNIVHYAWLYMRGIPEELRVAQITREPGDA